ncbi:hypothetical protein BAUCODRAFT_388387 [Baudoinia panamericana UAMH 10762]|uniref:Uncharacterized protein n=1 Tax=Baudoinia panamericana (strain UAMH 10762) TaxID=717646 RepID=M2NIW7_BAUPA|nr:uncharacterized protein BAUCODRAFT_388387 [Baudoinia panamericana UAMH 10762]EMC99030.1 hypothetical protein BAUCODRAFT_388387 [Baudoinia panamericana UAMH 10762]
MSDMGTMVAQPYHSWSDMTNGGWKWLSGLDDDIGDNIIVAHKPSSISETPSKAHSPATSGSGFVAPATAHSPATPTSNHITRAFKRNMEDHNVDFLPDQVEEAEHYESAAKKVKLEDVDEKPAIGRLWCLSGRPLPKSQYIRSKPILIVIDDSDDEGERPERHSPRPLAEIEPAHDFMPAPTALTNEQKENQRLISQRLREEALARRISAHATNHGADAAAEPVDLTQDDGNEVERRASHEKQLKMAFAEPEATTTSKRPLTANLDGGARAARQQDAFILREAFGTAETSFSSAVSTNSAVLHPQMTRGTRERRRDEPAESTFTPPNKVQPAEQSEAPANRALNTRGGFADTTSSYADRYNKQRQQEAAVASKRRRQEVTHKTEVVRQLTGKRYLEAESKRQTAAEHRPEHPNLERPQQGLKLRKEEQRPSAEATGSRKERLERYLDVERRQDDERRQALDTKRRLSELDQPRTKDQPVISSKQATLPRGAQTQEQHPNHGTTAKHLPVAAEALAAAVNSSPTSTPEESDSAAKARQQRIQAMKERNTRNKQHVDKDSDQALEEGVDRPPPVSLNSLAGRAAISTMLSEPRAIAGELREHRAAHRGSGSPHQAPFCSAKTEQRRPLSLSNPAGQAAVSEGLPRTRIQADCHPSQRAFMTGSENKSMLESIHRAVPTHRAAKFVSNARRAGRILPEDIHLIRWRSGGVHWPEVTDHYEDMAGKRRSTDTLRSRLRLVSGVLEELSFDEEILTRAAQGREEAVDTLNNAVKEAVNTAIVYAPVQSSAYSSAKDCQRPASSTNPTKKAPTSERADSLTDCAGPAPQHHAVDLATAYRPASPEIEVRQDGRPNTGGKTLNAQTFHYFMDQWAKAQAQTYASSEAEDEDDSEDFDDPYHFVYQVQRRELSQAEADEEGGLQIQDMTWIDYSSPCANHSAANTEACRQALISNNPAMHAALILGGNLARKLDDNGCFSATHQCSAGTLEVRVERRLQTVTSGCRPDFGAGGHLSRNLYVVKERSTINTRQTSTTEGSTLDADLFGEEPENTVAREIIADDVVYSALELANDQAIRHFVEKTVRPTLNLTAWNCAKTGERNRLSELLAEQGEDAMFRQVGESIGAEGGLTVKTETEVWVERVWLRGPRNM